jgi:Tfp pilus assembly protein PilF
MRNHFIIWTAALCAVAVATGLWFVRQAPFRPNANRPSPGELVQQAMLELEGDPAAADVWTQSVIRAAAVEVEAGRTVSAEGDYLLAMQYQRERNLAAAEALFKRAILRAPEWSRAYAGLANLLGRHTYGRLDDAEVEIKKAIALEPGWGRAYDILAVIHRLDGKLKEAEAAAKKAIELDPGNVAHLNNYANLLMEMKRYKDAEAQYRAAINADPENAKPYYNLACLYVKINRDKNAIEYLKNAIERAPNLRDEASVDPDLDPLRGQREFEKLITAPNEQAPEAKEKPKAPAKAKK